MGVLGFMLQPNLRSTKGSITLQLPKVVWGGAIICRGERDPWGCWVSCFNPTYVHYNYQG